MIDSIEHESRRLGYNLIMTSFDAHNAGEVFDMLRSQPQEDGLILLGTEWYPHDNTYLQELHSPLVIVDNLLAVSYTHLDVYKRQRYTRRVFPYLPCFSRHTGIPS